jgi:hypothetical protein
MNPETFWLGFACGQVSMIEKGPGDDVDRITLTSSVLKRWNATYAVVATPVNDKIEVMIVPREAPSGEST